MPDLTWTESKVPLASSADGGVPEWPMHFKKHMREKDWAPHKEKIIRLRDYGLKTEDIQECLIREDGFHATIAQYKKILKDWRPKNLKRKQIRYIVYTCKRRGLDHNNALPRFWYSTGKSKKKQTPYIKESQSENAGMLVYIEEDKVEDTVKRYWKSEVFSANEHPSPAGLSVAPTPATVYTPGGNGTPGSTTEESDPFVEDSQHSLSILSHNIVTSNENNKIGTEQLSLNSSPMDIENEEVENVPSTTPLETESCEIEEDFDVVGGSPQSIQEIEVVDLTTSSPLIEIPASVTAPSTGQPGVPITEEGIAEFAEKLLRQLNIHPSNNNVNIATEGSSAQDFTEWQKEQERQENDKDISQEIEATMSRDNVDDVVEEVIRGNIGEWTLVDLDNTSPPIHLERCMEDKEILEAGYLVFDMQDFMKAKRFEEALVANETSMNVFFNREGVDSERFLYLYSVKGKILLELGRYSEATAHLTRAYSACEKYLGRLHAFTLGASYDLLLVKSRTGYELEATNDCKILWQAINEIPASEIDKEISILRETVMLCFIDLMYDAAWYSEGEAFIRARIKEYEPIQGGEFHPDTIRLMTALADFISKQEEGGKRRSIESIRILDRAIETADRGNVIVKDPVAVMDIWYSRAKAYRNQGWFEASVFSSQKLLKSLKSMYGINRYSKEAFFLTSALELAETYRNMKWYDHSLAYISRALPILIDLVGPSQWRARFGIEIACEVLYSRGMVRYAEPLARNIPYILYDQGFLRPHQNLESRFLYYYHMWVNISQEKMICT